MPLPSDPLAHVTRNNQQVVIERLRAQFDALAKSKSWLDRERGFRLLKRIHRLEAALYQIRLPL